MIREEVEEHSRAFWQKDLPESGRVGGRGTFGTHKPSGRAGVQYGMGCLLREATRKQGARL